ncbi:MAG: hypothetical protein NTY03_14040 [Candidatus Bathyarchaeota archaeon]|jgi:hypothetical protein|nr:hypothetical protein [Candidatus Bathyarchaeota archaeon]
MQSISETEILFTLIKTRFGDQVTPEELEEMRKGLTAILDAAKAMRSIKLENGDEPYQFFKPYGDCA